MGELFLQSQNKIPIIASQSEKAKSQSGVALKRMFVNALYLFLDHGETLLTHIRNAKLQKQVF